MLFSRLLSGLAALTFYFLSFRLLIIDGLYHAFFPFALVAAVFLTVHALSSGQAEGPIRTYRPGESLTEDIELPTDRYTDESSEHDYCDYGYDMSFDF